MRVKSKVDIWIRVLIWFTILIMTGSMFIMPKEAEIIGLLLAAPTVCLMVWIYFGTYYELRDDYLYCRSGPFVEKIPYERIKSVKPSRNMLASMALSIQRIEIRQHGKGYITGTTYISPVNRDEFMAELISRV